MAQQMQMQIKNFWAYILRKLFSYPSVVLIGGTWKTGKTDFALKISEDLAKLGLIREVASNIDTSGYYPQIADLISLRHWLYASKKKKLYIFDEASEHLPSRRSMSAKNVGFIQIIPEISKAHAKMLVVGHNLEKVDKTLINSVWCRGVFTKSNLKNAQLFSHLFSQPYVFNNIPRTSITFDPYAIAPFTEKPPGNIYFKDDDLQLLWRWCNGENYKDLGIAPMTLHRKLKKFIRQTLENELNT